MESDSYSESPLVDQIYLLKRFPDKYGWTYVAIPEIVPCKHVVFNWIKVKGTIDDYEMNNFHLMPLTDGTLYFSVSGQICNKIGKKPGDKVHVILFADHSPTEIPVELMNNLKNNPAAYMSFKNLTESLQLGIIDWIYCALNEEIRDKRIAKTIERLIG